MTVVRLAGVAGPGPQARAAALAGMLARAGWAGEARADGGAATLAAPPGMAAVAEGLVVALEGRVFAPVPDGDPAAWFAGLARRHGVAGAMARVNGDIAAAVHDPASGRTWLARDRLGLRPLYHASAGGTVAFASRPRPLFHLVAPDPDPDALARVAGSHYRAIDADPGRSPYRAVAQVPAGTVVEVTGGTARAERYWGPPFPPLPTTHPAELAEVYRDLLIDAVRIRMRSLERPAFTLSGGMDSSSVLACAVRDAGARQHAFSTVYDDATYDESAEIASMLDAAVEEWHRVAIGTPDVLGLVAQMVRDHDEPVATATWLSHRLLVRAAAGAGFGGLMGGLGGDELNAGEYEYFPCRFADLRAEGREADLAHEIACWARHHDHPVFRKGPKQAEDMMARLTDPARPGACLPDAERLTRYAAALTPDLAGRVRAFAPVMESPFPTCLANRAWQDLTRETLPCCLRAGDRNAAAAGIDRVEPFLDHRLVELMFMVPGDLKIRDGVTKRLLRDAMTGVLPEETRTRVAKTGWNAPAHMWFSGAGRGGLMDLVRSRAFRERGVYDPAEVERLVAEHDAVVASGEPRENHMMFLWQLVNVELWLASLDGEPPPGAEVTPP